MLAQSASTSSNQGGQLLACLAICLLAIIRCIFKFIAQYGLIYCGIFGVPFFEGCRRFVELRVKKYVHILMGGCIVSTALTMNTVVFSLLAAVFAFLISIGLFGFNYWAMVFYPIGTFIICYFFMNIFTCPITTLSDTLFVCYCECPSRIAVLDPELPQQLEDTYSEQLTKQIEARNKAKGQQVKNSTVLS